MTAPKHVEVFTDGACLGNPGVGGFGVVLKYRGRHREISGGFRRTTNNRMELRAVIEGLLALRERCQVTVYSDSQYIVKAMSQGWAERWRAFNWIRKGGEPALNADLWAQLLDVCALHAVTFKWVRGHAGHKENERCDVLAKAAAKGPTLADDEGFRKSYVKRG